MNRHALRASVLALIAVVGCEDFPSDVSPLSDSPSGKMLLLQVVSKSPERDATGVLPGSLITVTFNQYLNPDSVVNPETNTSTNAVLVKNGKGSDVPGTVTYNPTSFTVTFIPSEALAPDTYRVIVRDVTTADGRGLIEPYEWSFEAVKGQDLDPLSVVATNPLPVATNVERSVVITVTFSAELDPTSVINPATNTSTGAILLKSQSGANVAGTVTYNPANYSVLFVPSAFLSANVTYSVTVKDVRNIQGFALKEPHAWTFTTGFNPSTPPSVIGTTPSSNATNISRDTSINVAFNEPVTGVTTSTFFVRDTLTNVVITPRTVIFDNTILTATYRAASLLNPNTTYTVTVQDVVGLVGITMPQYSWNFTTGQYPDTTPVVTSTSPLANAVSVPRNARVEAVLDRAVTAASINSGFTLRNTLTNTQVTAEATTFSNQNLTATFIPTTFLTANTNYTARLRNIAGVDGIIMPEISWSFTTSATPDNVVPTITAAGLAAKANCSSNITLTWPAASDDVTPQSGISYQIFQSEISAGYDLNVPAYTTSAGVTTYQVTGLDRAKTYYFTVRAVDASFNRSTNFTERSATTSAYLHCPAITSLAGGPTAVTAADFNGDAKIDLAITCQNTNSVAILLGNNDGTFTPATPATIAVGNQPDDIKSGDFTNDGKRDLVVANRAGGTISILPGNGNGTFGAAVNTTVAQPLSLATGEFNNPANANLDLAVGTGDDVSILSGNGNGTFSGTIPRLTVAATADARSVVTGDFDGDGLVDVGVCYSGTDSVGAFLNSTPGAGALAFTAPTTATNRLYTVQNAPSALCAVDLNCDGRPDLANVNLGTPSATIRLSSALSANLFPAGDNTALPAGSSSGSMAAGDIDGDGYPDLVIANRGTGTVSVLINLAGTGIFTVDTQDAGTFPTGVAIADFNADGKPDVAVTDFLDNTVSIFLNAN
jgi:hypothetical protein